MGFLIRDVIHLMGLKVALERKNCEGRGGNIIPDLGVQGELFDNVFLF